MLKAKIFEIKRFAVHDGDGIRSTVFLKGCPLKCVWCHNPEGIDFAPQLAYYGHKCCNCGECAKVCPENAHTVENGKHVFDRSKCSGCGKCEKTCLYGALFYYGNEVTVEELIPVLLEDREFYETTNGGVTISGGECLIQAEFCEALLKRLKEEGIHTAVDTCGFVSRSAIERVLPYTDVFLYDVKAFDENAHIRCTGQSNRLVLENLEYIDAQGKAMEIRIPFVPEYNQAEMEKIARYLSKLKSVTKVRILPYHNYAGSKYTALGMKNTLPERLPRKEELEKVRTLFESYGLRLAD